MLGLVLLPLSNPSTSVRGKETILLIRAKKAFCAENDVVVRSGSIFAWETTIHQHETLKCRKTRVKDDPRLDWVSQAVEKCRNFFMLR